MRARLDPREDSLGALENQTINGEAEVVVFVSRAATVLVEADVRARDCICRHYFARSIALTRSCPSPVAREKRARGQLCSESLDAQVGERASRDPMIARFSRIGARIWVGSPFRLSLEGLTGSQEASGAPPRSLGSSCTDGCHYAGTPLFGCRIGVPPKSPLLLVQGSSHASCAMCCVYAPFVFIYSSNVDTTSRFTRTSSPHKLFVNRDC